MFGVCKNKYQGAMFFWLPPPVEIANLLSNLFYKEPRQRIFFITDTLGIVSCTKSRYRGRLIDVEHFKTVYMYVCVYCACANRHIAIM